MAFTWKIIESACLDPAGIMEKDARLLSNLASDDSPIIHFYEWSVPSLTYGYFTDPGRFLNLNALKDCGVGLAKRPTGGGIIFHLTDFAFSVLLPAGTPSLSINPLENYALINRWVAEAVGSLPQLAHPPDLLTPSLESTKSAPFCMAKPTQYDLVIDGRKVGGAAQRRTKNGLLHQASISVKQPPADLLRKVLLEPESVLKAMGENSYCILPSNANAQGLKECRRQLKELLIANVALYPHIGQ